MSPPRILRTLLGFRLSARVLGGVQGEKDGHLLSPHMSPHRCAVPWEAVGIPKFTEVENFSSTRLSWGVPVGCVLGVTSRPEFMVPCGPATVVGTGRSEPVGAGPAGQGPAPLEARTRACS